MIVHAIASGTVNAIVIVIVVVIVVVIANPNAIVSVVVTERRNGSATVADENPPLRLPPPSPHLLYCMYHLPVYGY